MEVTFVKAVILAAGVGSRLGRSFPKCLSVLPGGESILQRQVRLLRQCGISEIVVVGGFKIHLLMEYLADVYYRYNPVYYITNTAKSLLYGIEHIVDDVIWMNGDVVFDEEVLEAVLNADENVVAVNTAVCGEEEVKYRTDASGKLVAISKSVEDAFGEAVGINKIGKSTIEALKDALRECSDSDYFERGLEYLIEWGVSISVQDISMYRCIEVDFEEDWEQVQQTFLHLGINPRE